MLLLGLAPSRPALAQEASGAVSCEEAKAPEERARPLTGFFDLTAIAPGGEWLGLDSFPLGRSS